VKLLILIPIFCLTIVPFAQSKTSPLLVDVEKHYREAQTVKMDVSKTLTLSLLDQTKKSQGMIKIKKGGLLRWESMAPTHSLVLADGKFIWLVDTWTAKMKNQI